MNKVKKTQVPFSQTPNELLKDKQISLTSKGLYAFMQGKPDNWNFTIASMQKQLKEGQRAIRSALTELKETGWLSYEKHNDGTGTYTVNITPVLETPKVQSVEVDNAKVAKRTDGVNSHVSDEDPNVQNPYVQNAMMAKRTRINKKDSIEKKIVSKKELSDANAPAPSTMIFNAYADAMRVAYGNPNIQPARNAKINKLLNNLIERVGYDGAMQVASNYPFHKNQWYVQKTHAVEYMVQDCEQILVQVQANKMVTKTQAQQTDKQGAFENRVNQMQNDPLGQEIF
jgi:hypothetical protein